MNLPPKEEVLLSHPLYPLPSCQPKCLCQWVASCTGELAGLKINLLWVNLQLGLSTKTKISPKSLGSLIFKLFLKCVTLSTRAGPLGFHFLVNALLLKNSQQMTMYYYLLLLLFQWRFFRNKTLPHKRNGDVTEAVLPRRKTSLWLHSRNNRVS